MYIFIVGRPHKPIVDQLHHHGHVVGLFQSQTDSGEYDEMVDISIKLDLSSQEAIQSGLQSLDVPHIDSLISIYENFVRPKAWIAEALGVASISVPAAIAATDKVIMRQKFLEFDPRISPQFAEVESWDDAQQFVETYGLPVILKPAHLVKSLLVSKNESLEELRRNYDYMVENMSSVYHKYNVESRQPKIIIEEFLSGQQFSVEAFVRNENEIFLTDSVTEQVTAREFGVEDSFLYSRTLPSQLPENEQAAIRDVAIRGIQALGLSHSAAHVEIIRTANGPKLIEIGARIGGYRTLMYQIAESVDLAQAEVDVSLGILPKLDGTMHTHCCVYEIFPQNETTYQGITEEEHLRALPSLHTLILKKRPGDPIGPAKAGYKFTSAIILANADKTQFDADRRFVDERVRVRE